MRAKDIKLNGKRIKVDLMCEIGDFIEVYNKTEVVKSPLALIFADENIAIFNKPSGITSEDFYNRVKGEYPTAAAVHRLDRNTRGIICYALNPLAEKELLKGFKDRSFKKYYLAEVVGIPTPKTAVITAYLQKSSDESRVYVHDTEQTGDALIKTAYTVIKSAGGTSVVEVDLLTGRTHQIRAHLAHIGHPIVGDGKYGDQSVNKKMGAKSQRLQAYKIAFAFSKDSALGYLDGKVFEVNREIGVSYEKDRT